MPRWTTLFYDEQLQELGSLVRVLDERLDRIDDAIEACPDPDGWGLLDAHDATCGLGLAAVQQYISSLSAFHGVNKKTALSCGPVIVGGLTVVAGVNHAANWWKHCDEWQLDAGGRAEGSTSDGVEALGVNIHDGNVAVLSTALATLVSPSESRFRQLLPLLKSWEGDLRARYPEPT